MDIKKAIIDQYGAALETLRLAIVKCPDQRWNESNSRKKFWQTAYHTLFYAHLYVHSSLDSFRPWAKHRNEYKDPDPAPESVEPCSREVVLEFLDHCRQVAAEKVATQDLEAASGFEWLPFSKLEAHIYNIRHIQHHAAELIEYLGANEGIEVNWVSTAPGSTG